MNPTTYGFVYGSLISGKTNMWKSEMSLCFFEHRDSISLQYLVSTKQLKNLIISRNTHELYIKTANRDFIIFPDK